MYTLTVIETADGKQFRRNDGRIIELVVVQPDDLPVGLSVHLPEECFDPAEEQAEDAAAADEQDDTQAEEQTA